MSKRLTSKSATPTSAKSTKLVIKPLGSHTPAKGNAFKSSIETLSRAIAAIQSNPPVKIPESLQALYQLCEGIINSTTASGSSNDSESSQLYDTIKLQFEKKSSAIRRSLVAGGMNGQEEEIDWIRLVEREWKQFLLEVGLVKDIFTALDRSFVIKNTAVLTIWDLGLDIFRHSVVQDETISQRLSTCFINTINQERSGMKIPRPLIKSLLSLLSALSTTTYKQIFTLPFLAASVPFYTAEGLALASQLTSGAENGITYSAYLKRVFERLSDEGERVSALVPGEIGMVDVRGGGKGRAGLKEDLEEIVLEGLVKDHLEAIVERDLGKMIDANQFDELTNVFTLLKRTDALRELKVVFRDHVKASGLQIVSNFAADEKMVDNLIVFRNKILTILKKCFAFDADFVTANSLAFEFFINKRENKPAEMMAKFLDSRLRIGNKGMSDDDLEASLNDVLALFRFTQGKDIFEAFYKKDLAKRLLLNKSASFDAERSMLLKLKDECGPGFTAKLEIMFKDIDLSTDVMRAYSGTTSRSSSTTTDLYVNVLSMGNWPTYPPVAPRLPEALSNTLEKFKQFYTVKYSGRTLRWQHSLDHCSLKANFPKGGKKELAVSLFQALVLLLFNEVPEGGRLGFKEIVETLRIDEKEAARTLQSLACGKVRVLQKIPKGREVADTDEFAFNTEFKDDHIKIKINQIQQKETAEENKSTTERVFTDRSSHLQLAIVRIMKARKTLKYTELVMETVSQVGHRFKVETAEIKKSIGSLIEREYLRRAEDNQNVFEYLA